MAIRTIKTIPSELPHARLYLDDIEEISSILLEAAAPLFAKLKEEAKICYAIGDTKMDSIKDLQTFGGDTSKLDIDFGSWGPSLMFRFYAHPELQMHSLDAEHAWATYGKVKSVFDRRQLRIKNAIETLPGWLKWLLWGLLVLSPEWFPHSHQHPLYFLIGYGAILVLVTYELYLHPSRVFFVRSHERTRISSEARRKNAREIIILVIGGVIGGLIIEIIHHFLYK
jgi:hypothetical protein